MAEQVQEAVASRPAAHLRPFVERYSGYRIKHAPPGLHRGLPSSHLTWIISLAQPIDVSAMPDRRQGGEAFGALVGGLHASPALIRHDGNQHGISLELTPLGARALFGLPAGALASTVVHLDALLGRRASELVDRLLGAPGWPDRFRILDDVLAQLVTDVPERSPEVSWAWHRLATTRGSIEVTALAEEIGWSRRHLGERFRAELGLTPKVAARVLRFDWACSLVKRSPRPSLAELAATCGYFDQAHMTRDWHDLAGCAPSTWIREELHPVDGPLVLADAS